MNALAALSAPFGLYVGVVATIVMIALWRFLSTGRALVGTAILAAWLLYAGLLGVGGVVRGQWLGIPGVFVLLAPVFAFVAVVLVRSPVGRALALSIPLPLIIGLQTFRVGVELMIHKLWELGTVPMLLTLNGGNVEILVGVSAPAVAWISRKGPAGRRLTLIWSAFGLLSLINVASRAVLTSPGLLQWIHSEVPNLAMGVFPFTYIPGFMAPLAVMLHVLAFKALAAARAHHRVLAAV
jgi:hypothetical protein